MHAVDEVLVLW